MSKLGVCVSDIIARMEETKVYKATIGLEIHAELKTKTKMFCNSRNDPEEKSPNVNVCPVCMAHPGTLPVINKAAVKHVIKIGLALGGTKAPVAIAAHTGTVSEKVPAVPLAMTGSAVVFDPLRTVYCAKAPR